MRLISRRSHNTTAGTTSEHDLIIATRRDWDRLRGQAMTDAERAEIDAMFSRAMP